MQKIATLGVIGISSLTLAACSSDEVATVAQADPITAAQVEAAQIAWGEGIVAIGSVFTEQGDYRARASEHIETHYAYDDDATILFKPTLAAKDQFRETTEEALSYFVGTQGSEDGGFAIKPYTDVDWENNGIVISDSGDMAITMGNYMFTDMEGDVTKVEYSFAYKKDENGNLKIVLHHSSIPFDPS